MFYFYFVKQFFSVFDVNLVKQKKCNTRSSTLYIYFAPLNVRIELSHLLFIHRSHSDCQVAKYCAKKHCQMKHHHPQWRDEIFVSVSQWSDSTWNKTCCLWALWVAAGHVCQPLCPARSSSLLRLPQHWVIVPQPPEPTRFGPTPRYPIISRASYSAAFIISGHICADVGCLTDSAEPEVSKRREGGWN